MHVKFVTDLQKNPFQDLSKRKLFHCHQFPESKSSLYLTFPVPQGQVYMDFISKKQKVMQRSHWIIQITCRRNTIHHPVSSRDALAPTPAIQLTVQNMGVTTKWQKTNWVDES